jgi:hypothetical protein
MSAEKFVVPVKGILTPIAEEDLTIEQLRYLFEKLIKEVNNTPLQVRAWLAQAILEQNNIKVSPPGSPPPVSPKKERNKTKVIKVKDDNKINLKDDINAAKAR